MRREKVNCGVLVSLQRQKFEEKCLSLFSITRLQQLSFRTRAIILIPILILARAILHLRIANEVVMDSCCRGGIVNTRGCCSRALLERTNSSKALWRFRASTSNSLSGRTRPPTDTQVRHIHHTYAQQDIRVYEDDHFEPPNRQS